MLGPPVQNPPHGSLQHTGIHTPDPENHIHADIVESSLPKLPERPPRPVGIVPAVHPAQHPVVQRLHAHTDPVHPERTQPGGILGSDVVRIHLDRPLPVTATSARIGNAAYKLKRQHRRGAASEIQSVHRCRGSYFILPCPCLRTDFIQPTLRRARPLRVEVTVGAETPAERNVNINHWWRLITYVPATS